MPLPICLHRKRIGGGEDSLNSTGPRRRRRREKQPQHAEGHISAASAHATASLPPATNPLPSLLRDARHSHPRCRWIMDGGAKGPIPTTPWPMYLCCRRLKDQRGVVRLQVGAGDRVGGPGSRGVGGRARGTCSSGAGPAPPGGRPWSRAAG